MGMLEATIRMRIGGLPIQIQTQVPEGDVGITGMLPLMRNFTDMLVQLSAETVTSQGKTITCRAGCGACCRQPVPVSEAEARALAAYVANLPQERRAAVVERFRAVLEKLAGAGLLDDLRRMQDLEDSERKELGMAYFKLGMPCPFLENEACSIYPIRPVRCREYLVTTPAEYCATPGQSRVERMGIAGEVSQILYRITAQKMEEEPRFLLLVTALDYAASVPPEETAPSQELVERFLRAMKDA
jgi:Fe-S-cluster containining protein